MDRWVIVKEDGEYFTGTLVCPLSTPLASMREYWYHTPIFFESHQRANGFIKRHSIQGIKKVKKIRF